MGFETRAWKLPTIPSLYDWPGMKWNESGFRPPLCTYRLNWARRTSWGWWDERDDTALQTHDSKFEPCRSEAEHANSRSRRLPTILTFTRGWGRNIFCFFQTAETGNRTPISGVKGSGANHYPRAPARPGMKHYVSLTSDHQASPNFRSMLAHRLLRWCNIVPTLVEYRGNEPATLCVTYTIWALIWIWIWNVSLLLYFIEISKANISYVYLLLCIYIQISLWF